ncbi:MAG: FUSC family protein [Firmicutes bacterium]|nr:FUSC family protein [Bacillota bacterium]
MRRWIPARVGAAALLRTAAAAATAWQVAAWTVGERPYLAPLAAILSTQVTAAASLVRGAERALAVAVGIVLATAAARAVGPSALSVGALVLVAMGLAQAVGMGAAAVPQVAVSAVLVLTVGSHHPAYGLERVADTVIGAATAVAFQIAAAPEEHAGAADAAVRRLAARSARLWRRGARAAGAHPRHLFAALWQDAAALEPELRDAEGAVALALEALRLRPLPSSARRRVDRLAAAFSAVERSLRHTRALLRLLAEHPLPTPLAFRPALCRAAAHLLAAAGGASRPGGSGRLRPAADRLRKAAACGAAPLAPPTLAALALEVDEWARDVERVATALEGVRTPRRSPPRDG